MGIQDRDYYRDKNAVNINYNPKEFRGSSGSSVNKAPESKARNATSAEGVFGIGYF